MDEQKVIQVLKEIFDKYGLENLRNVKTRDMVVKAYIPDMLNKMEYRDENIVLTQAMKSDAMFSLMTSNVTEDAAQRVVDRLESEEHMRREDAEFVVRCIMSVHGRKISFEREQKEESKNSAAMITDRNTDMKVCRYEDHGSYVEIVGLVSDSITEVEIPTEIEGKPVTKIGSYAFDGCRRLTSIELPDSITEIEEGAFRYCRRLTSIELPDSITEIEEGAFRYCFRLSSIELPDSITEIGPYAFQNCFSLTSIELPDSITRIGREAFSDCENLKMIRIPKHTDVADDAFTKCPKLRIFKYKNRVH